MKKVTKREIIEAALANVAIIRVAIHDAEERSANARRELDRLIDGLRRCQAPNATAEGEQSFVGDLRARIQRLRKEP